ncbi:CBO0543 family protein [Paenibacillus harenae]|uniref:Phosphoglycerol transferase MdoB-like AlkP superfamily enzyme n=1 Tax=Paenibacillus harenae TaxID=306543 RepID=A0ABT9UAV1_PAEHA|nr:CBO0543 family protein [Paenibacillus harenae]MDQ0116141.1 phosphoglycerol transferase MdoB-like AlkP superfamily enzyme [Paenibacillus harenae]
MHIAIALFTIFAAWRWGDWSKWKQYHSTMLYIVTGGLLYEYLTRSHPLWTFHPDVLPDIKLVVLIHAFISMPLSIFIFLSRYPAKPRKPFRYIIMWVCIYVGVEAVLAFFGRITYDHGWQLYHSVLFNLMMFTMMRFHHVSPGKAYLVSIVIIVALMKWFQVPLS